MFLLPSVYLVHWHARILFLKEGNPCDFLSKQRAQSRPLPTSGGSGDGELDTGPAAASRGNQRPQEMRKGCGFAAAKLSLLQHDNLL
jgi:hypothetical protein